MNTLISPTSDGFADLSSILSRLADGRAALGDALIYATETDAGLFAEAAQFRRKAATPQKYWHFVTTMQSMSGQAGANVSLALPQSTVAGGVYGPKIVAAASSSQVAADGCLAARDAQLMVAQAGKELAQWFARHGASGSMFLMTAQLDEREAEHLALWASRLRLGATVDLV